MEILFHFKQTNNNDLLEKDGGKKNISMLQNNYWVKLPASGRGARVSACAGLINQLQRCRFVSRIACLENHDTAIEGDWWTGVGGHQALYC